MADCSQRQAHEIDRIMSGGLHLAGNARKRSRLAELAHAGGAEAETAADAGAARVAQHRDESINGR